MVLSNNRFKLRAFFDRSCPCLLMEDGKVLAKWSWTNSHVNCNMSISREINMIVEVFLKGSNFKDFFETFWSIEKIEHDNGNFILITEYGKDNIVLNSSDYELRVCY